LINFQNFVHSKYLVGHFNKEINKKIISQPIPLPTSYWLHYFPNLKVSALEFDSEVENALKTSVSPTAKASSQSGIFSTKREYTRVVNGCQTLDICAPQ